MTIECLSIMPRNPEYLPPADTRDAALAALRRMLPAAESVEVFVHEEIRFIDSGIRFESIRCPLCAVELDQIWWGDAMNRAQRSGFEELRVTLPCCDVQSSLNDLRYNMHSGFARFLLQAREPGLGKYLPPDRMRALEVILDTPLTQVWTTCRKHGENLVRIHGEATRGVARGAR